MNSNFFITWSENCLEVLKARRVIYLGKEKVGEGGRGQVFMKMFKGATMRGEGRLKVFDVRVYNFQTF